MSIEALDKETYSHWQAVEAVMTPVDMVSDHKKYVIRAYLYIRSRLLVPGRNYEDEDHGPLAAGGNAHADLIDFDIWLQSQADPDGQLRQETLDWMRDASLEDVAYWRGLRHRSSVKHRRDKIVENKPSMQQTTPFGHRE